MPEPNTRWALITSEVILLALIASCGNVQAVPTAVATSTPTATPHIDLSLFPISLSHHLAFVSDRDGNDELYLMDTAGDNQTRITESEASERHPVWSSDGRYLAYSRCPPSRIMYWCATSYLVVLDGRSGQENIITEWKSDSGKSDVWWTSNDECLAYKCTSGIHEVPSNLHNRLSCQGYNTVNPAICTGDKQLCVNTEVNCHQPFTPTLTIMSSASTSLTLTWPFSYAAAASNLSWSPDSQYLAMIMASSTKSTLLVYRYDNPEPKFFTEGSYPWGMSWSPDSQWIAFSAVDQNSNLDIYITNVETKETNRLTTDPARDYDPAWSPVQ